MQREKEPQSLLPPFFPGSRRQNASGNSWIWAGIFPRKNWTGQQISNGRNWLPSFGICGRILRLKQPEKDICPLSTPSIIPTMVSLMNPKPFTTYWAIRINYRICVMNWRTLPKRMRKTGNCFDFIITSRKEFCGGLRIYRENHFLLPPLRTSIPSAASLSRRMKSTIFCVPTAANTSRQSIPFTKITPIPKNGRTS